jgi:hypothetical protein
MVTSFMTDQQSQQRINEAAEQFTDALVNSYKVVAESGVSAQERSTQVTEVFFNQTINSLHAQAEQNRQATQQLADQQQRQVEAAQTLTRESVEAYMDFMDSMFSWWQGGIQTAERGARETEKAEGRTEREGTEGHNAYFRKVIEETNRRAGAKAS